ncbi:MAG: hypothetical protein WEB37_08760, partial [Bacteroidota bacterium]
MAQFTKAVLLVLFLAGISAADGKTWNLVLSEGDTLFHCKLLHVSNGMLVFSQDAIDSVSIESVAAVFRQWEGSFWTGAKYGALAGGVVGAVIGAASYEEPRPKSDPNGGYFSDLDIGFGTPALSAVGAGILGAAGGIFIGGTIG